MIRKHEEAMNATTRCFTAVLMTPSESCESRCDECVNERWHRKFEHRDKWKLCDNNPGLRPEKAG